jgi:hypothetical protein
LSDSSVNDMSKNQNSYALFQGHRVFGLFHRAIGRISRLPARPNQGNVTLSTKRTYSTKVPVMRGFETAKSSARQ